MSKSSKRNKTSSTEEAVSYRDKQTKMGNNMSDEDSPTHRKRGGNRHMFGASFFRKWSDKDTEQYRKGYPGKKDHPELTENLMFYTGKIKSHPDGDYIKNIHEDWWGNFRLLETHHGYIQWLFPIRESGMNFYSQELQLHEIKKIMADKEAHARVLKSYEMMLHFYGMELTSKETGIIKRGEDWKSRFRHLNSSYHNYLRITRILKSLGEFGYEHLKQPFVEFVLQEALETGELSNTLESCMNYWIGTIKDDGARKYLKDYVREVQTGKHMESEPSDEDEEMLGVYKETRTSRVNDSNLNSNEFSVDSQEAGVWNQSADGVVEEGPSRSQEVGNGDPSGVSGGDKESVEENMEIEQNSTEGESNTKPKGDDTQSYDLSKI
ncbi:opioid growth factor receptor-like protein 1 [Argopecten irradians]|uniref:opioid growth factor receptor-like protein 1 n=1 Tax=Argopecten irradians TaxID=31199 RepID=UPI0037157B5E